MMVRILAPMMMLWASAAPAQPLDSARAMDAMLEGVSPLAAPELAKRIAAASGKPLGSPANPVRADGPEGQRAYIARLRCGDGKRPELGQRDNIGVGVFGSIIDVFPLDCGKSAPGKLLLHMDAYHKGHVEDEPPPGLTLAPAGTAR